MTDIINTVAGMAREGERTLIEFDLAAAARNLRYLRLAEYGLVFIGLSSGVAALIGANTLTDLIAAVALIGFGVVASLSIGKFKLALWRHYLWIFPLSAIAIVWVTTYELLIPIFERGPITLPEEWQLAYALFLVVLAVLGTIGASRLPMARLMPTDCKILDILSLVERIRRERGTGRVPGRPIRRARGIILLVLGVVAVLFLGGMLGWAICAFFLIRSRRNFQTSPDSVFGVDQRPPILFLRSFVDDEVVPKTGQVHYDDFQRVVPLDGIASAIDFSVEMRLANYFANFGPFVAIGSPHEKVPVPGAVRIKLSDDEWQQWATRQMENAATIIMYAGVTRWVDWELEQVIRRGVTGKLILLFPKPALPKRSREKPSKHIVRTAEDLEIRLAKVKAAFTGTRWQAAWDKIGFASTLIAARLDDAGAVTVFRNYQRENDAYQIAVEIAHLAILGQLPRQLTA